MCWQGPVTSPTTLGIAPTPDTDRLPYGVGRNSSSARNSPVKPRLEGAHRPSRLPRIVHTVPVIICECCPILLPMNDSVGARPAPSSQSAKRMAASPVADTGASRWRATNCASRPVEDCGTAGCVQRHARRLSLQVHREADDRRSPFRDRARSRAGGRAPGGRCSHRHRPAGPDDPRAGSGTEVASRCRSTRTMRAQCTRPRTSTRPTAWSASSGTVRAELLSAAANTCRSNSPTTPRVVS